MPVILSFFQGQISLGSLGVMAAVGMLAVSIWQVSRVGSATVGLLESRNRVLEQTVEDLTERNAEMLEAAHQAELLTKEREKTIAELKARPDTAQMLDAFELNQTAVLRVLDDISSGLTTLINRDHTGRKDDQ